jgi:hypothetical protein
MEYDYLNELSFSQTPNITDMLNMPIPENNNEEDI